MRLGEMLVAEGLVSSQGVEEALESQVVQGGRLGTNLVELGLVSEKDLARMLGKQHNVAFASGEMNPDPRALELVDPDWADQKDVLPMRVDSTRVSVAVINPQDIEALDAIAFKAGKRVVPVVIPEFRMNQLLRRYCKAFRTVRSIDMNVIRPSKTLAKADAGAKAGADLMSEDEFQSLYHQAMSGGREETEEEVIEGTELLEPVSEPKVPAVSPPSAPMPAPVPLGASPTPPTPSAPTPAVEAPPMPLTFPEAQAQLAKSPGREDIATAVLRFAIGKWKRCLLLSVQGDLVTGWRGMGQGVREKAVRRIGVALRGQSTFKLVRDTRSHFIGPVKRDAGTAVFYKLLGGGYPQTAVLLPLLVRGEVVHVLYVDNGPGQLTPPDVGELLILSQSVARSYETLIKRRKSA